ncbi:hypothetical protein CRV03_05790 [Arcobacter sp. F155]|uniref:DMT family transporter n=1 Tax=Arcobacter sp. F155 TaxID=2044512 RepID=UPI00100BDAAD|nr:DMT family transporter [Arcobacter sp. F155]RXJ77195.1 hypothetical protein CRV03_05790 [Arcobacter sp. F155]
MYKLKKGKYFNIGYLFGFCAIFIWSFTAYIVKSYAEPKDGLSVAFFSILFSILFSIGYFFLKEKHHLKSNMEILKNNHKLKLYIFISAVFICLHYLSIYYIFSTPYVVQGNIINYMWPLLFFILSSFISGKEALKKTKVTSLIFIFTSFIGAVLIASGDELTLNFMSDYKYLGISLVSAISAAIYFFTLSKLKTSLYGNLNHFIYTSFFFIIVLFIVFLIHPQIIDTKVEVIILSFFLGLFSIFLGNVFWTLSLNKIENKDFSSVAYFVPVISTFILLFMTDEEFNNYIFVGLILIVISNILIHFNKEILHTVNICFSIIVMYSGICYLIPPLHSSTNNSMVNMTATVFTFYTAFLLNRIWNQRKDEEAILLNILEAVCKRLDKAEVSEKEKIQVINTIKVKMINRDKNFNMISYLSDAFYHYEIQITKKIFVLNKELFLLKSKSVTFPELLVIFMLGIISLIYVITYRESTLIGDLIAIAFASSVTYIIYIVHDFNKYGFMNTDKILRVFNYLKIQKDNHSYYLIKQYLLIVLLVLAILVIAFLFFNKYFTNTV